MVTAENINRKISQAIADKKNREEVKKKKPALSYPDDTPVNLLAIPNRVIFMEAGYIKDTTFVPVVLSPIQIKILMYVLKELQPFIKPQIKALKELNVHTGNRKNEDGSNDFLKRFTEFQKGLFKNIPAKYYCVLPKKLFVKSKNYSRLEKEFDKLSGLHIRVEPCVSATLETNYEILPLFSGFQNTLSPPDKKRNRNFVIDMSGTAVMHLCSIGVANKGESRWDKDYYSQCVFEAVFGLKSRYAAILYLYLCAWRKRGGWRVKTEKLRKLLGLQDKYIRSSAFMQYVVGPCNAELKKSGFDFWFEAGTEKDCIWFKIITRQTPDTEIERRNNLILYLKSCRLSESNIQSIAAIISDTANDKKIRAITTACLEHYFDTDKFRMQPITDIGAYITAAIQKWHRNSKKFR